MRAGAGRRGAGRASVCLTCLSVSPSLTFSTTTHATNHPTTQPSHQPPHHPTEYYTGANALGPYFIGRTIADIPFLGLFLLLVVVPYWMAGLTPEIGNFIRYLFIFFLIINGSASTGYLASSFSPDPVLGLAITPVLATPMILFSGMLYERASVPLFLQWIQHISVINYGFAALVINECNSIGDGPMRWLVLHFLQIDLDMYGQCILALLGLAFGYRFLSYLVLKVRMRYATSL